MAGKAFASGKHAYGLCDRCGWRYKYKALRKERVNDQLSNLKVCPECYDPDHPQNKLGKKDYHDPQALWDPRPQNDLTESRTGDDVFIDFTDGITGWIAWPGASGTATLTHDSTNGWANIVYANTIDPQFYTNGTQSIAGDDHVKVIIRLRWVNDTGDTSLEDADLFVQFFWARTIDGGYDSGRSILKNHPVPFHRMGDRWVDVEFDMDGVTDWDGTVNSLRFDIFGVAPGGDTMTFDVDIAWIRVEKRVS